MINGWSRGLAVIACPPHTLSHGAHVEDEYILFQYILIMSKNDFLSRA